MYRCSIVAVGILIGCLCSSPSPGADPPAKDADAMRSGMAEHFHFFPSKTANAKGWAVLLPGSSGLAIFGDDRHYHKAAEKIAAADFDVLLVDHKAAYKTVRKPPEGTTGAKIAWTAEQAIEWLRSTKKQTADRPGVLVGWSLGAEGIWRITNDAGRCSRLGVRGGALYYPANLDEIRLTNRVRLLVQTGESDDVTRVADIRKRIDDRPADAAEATLHVFKGAHHGFDVASLKPAKKLRNPPLIGTLHTMEYQQEAAEKAEANLLAFLKTVTK